MNNDEQIALVGKCQHGKVRFAAADEPKYIIQCRKDIADMALAGFTFSRMTAAEVRKGLIGIAKNVMGRVGDKETPSEHAYKRAVESR